MQNIETLVTFPCNILDCDTILKPGALGPGSNASQRVSDHVLDDEQAKAFAVEKVFLERPAWIDFLSQN